MAYEIPVLDITLLAASDLSAAQYHFVVVDADGQAALAGKGAAVVGIVQNKPGAATGDKGESTSVRVYGVSKVVAAQTVAAGALVASDSQGAAAVAQTGDHIAGIALIGGDMDEIICVLLTHGGIAE
jgi:hypothetical protein